MMKMRCIVGVLALALVVSCAQAVEEQKGWSWGREVDAKPVEATEDDYIADESAVFEQQVAANTNSTAVEDVIDTILVSNRQGRNVEGFDEVYQDPNVQQALENGDDTQARNIIKDRLCSLGLMQCDGESVDPKRPYVAPEDLIYAQPVDIKPIGRPIPSIPVRGPPRAYGPPKPVTLSHGPPRKVGYGGPIRPGFPPSKYGPPFPGNFNGQGGFSSNSHNSFSSGSSFEGASGPSYLSKPPGPIYENVPVYESEPPYSFERPIKQGYKDVKQSHLINSQGAASSLVEVGAVQHVHHHYHHGEDTKKQTVIVNNPIPVGAESHVHNSGVSSSVDYQSGSGFSGVNGGGFSPVNSGFGSPGGLYTSVKPVYENSAPGYSGGIYNNNNNKGQSQSLSGVYNLGYATGSRYTPSSGSGSFGSTVGSYGNTNQFYKKELNTAPANNNLLGGGSAYAGSNQYSSQFGYGQESGRAENYDCVCVPYDQCPSQDIIGRKDDLFLPIDPRNLNKDIDALPEEKVVITDGNGTMTIVRVPKNAVLDNVTDSSSESKKVSKREVNDKASDSASKANIEPRQRGSDDDDSRGLFGKKIQPTFGVSFGLPHSGYGGYPLNPYGPNPIINPYGSAVGGAGGGLNLGLVSVDPLVSVQVTKNDYGEKVIKPLVNLHVTPNGNLVHKIGSLLSHKKEILFNKPFGHGGVYGGGFAGGFGGGYGGQYPIHHNHYHYGPQKPHFHHGPPPFSHPPIHHSSPHRPPFHYSSPHHSHPPPFYASGPGPFSYSGGFRGVEIDDGEEFSSPYVNDADDINVYSNQGGEFYGRSTSDNNANNQNSVNNYAQNYNSYQNNPLPAPGQADGGRNVKFPSNRRRREASESDEDKPENKPISDETEARAKATKRQAYNQQQQLQQQCGPRHVCCKRPNRPQVPGVNRGQCGSRHSQGINGRIKNPVYVDGDSEFGEYPWQAAILKKDPKESVYVCGGTLIDHLHIMTAAHCVKTYTGFDLRVRLGEWDVNHDVEFFPYIERDVVSVHVHPQYYAGTLDNDLAILKLDHPVDWTKYPHISPACLPDKFTEFTGSRCWTTGWGKDAFGDFGKYQNILKEVDVPIIGHNQCQAQLRQTRLGYQYQLNPGFICAGGEEGKDACKGDGGGPMVCERGGTWQLVGVVSWGIGCGQVNVPGVYVKVSHYLDWIAQITGRF